MRAAAAIVSPWPPISPFRLHPSQLRHLQREAPMQAVTDRDRWLALGLLLAALALAYLLLVHPWWTLPMRDAQEGIHALQERSQRARLQLQQAPAVAARRPEAMDADRQVPVFLPEASAGLACAGLAQRLETEVERASPGNAGCGISTRTPI